jgi:hypothetical protein
VPGVSGRKPGVLPVHSGSVGEIRKPLTVSQLDDVAITSAQGFRAMGKFLRAYFDRTSGTGWLRTIAGDVELEGGYSTDPAALSDWVECVNAVLAEDDPG